MIILKDILASCGEFFPIPFAVTDFSIKEQPLIFVNDPFLNLTGYKKEDVLGQNCRFLQALAPGCASTIAPHNGPLFAEAAYVVK